MNAETAQQCVDWLKTLPHNVRGPKPVQVTLAKEEYFGAMYWDVHSNELVLYLIGDAPKVWKKRKACCFKDGEHADEWFITGWYNKAWLAAHGYNAWADMPGRASEKEVHPFGDHFCLRQWTVKDETIDQYEKHKYTRHKIVIESL